MNVIFRCDGSAQIGTGHIMRCLALAQAFQDLAADAQFVLAIPIPALESRLAAEGFSISRITAKPGSPDDAKETIAKAKSANAEWVIVDGYHFDTEYQKALKDSGLKLLFIDDYGHCDRYCADLVLNQNIYANEGVYPHREPHTQLLLGTRYVMLRREFLKFQNWKREIPPHARKVLVTLGGADPDNVTLKVIQALQKLEVDGLEALVIAGGSNPHFSSLKAAVDGSQNQIQLLQNVSEMPERMAWADLAIAAGGSTCWELLFMGLPSVLFTLAQNQVAVVDYLDKHGLGRRTDIFKTDVILREMIDSAAQREEICKKCRQTVDVFGTARIAMKLANSPVRLRRVEFSDARKIFEWANDPNVRNVSFSSKSITWDEHCGWLKSKLAEPNCQFHIAVDADENDIGQVRCAIDKHTAVISIALAASSRGRGLGAPLIRAACEHLFRSTNVEFVNAYIKTGNLTSVRVFEKAGFAYAGTIQINGNEAVNYVLKRKSAP